MYVYIYIYIYTHICILCCRRPPALHAGAGQRALEEGPGSEGHVEFCVDTGVHI